MPLSVSIAPKIPACKYVELGGVDHLPFVGNQDEILDEIEEFLTGVRHAGEKESGAGEILASRRVKDLVAGSGIVFADYGLKQMDNGIYFC